MTNARRALVLAVAAAVACAPAIGTGTAHAACPPNVSPRLCDLVTDPLPDRCWYVPDTGHIYCEWDPGAGR